MHNACKIGKIYLQNFSLLETILFFSSQNGISNTCCINIEVNIEVIMGEWGRLPHVGQEMLTLS